MNQILRSFGTRIPMVVLFAGVMISVSACEHHHHWEENHVAVVDEHGWRHEGYYDADKHWHGGYYDEKHEFHNDAADWHH